MRNLDHPSLSVKMLSRNWITGSCSLLARFHPGYQEREPHRLGRLLIGYVTSGELRFDGRTAGRGDLIHLPADSAPVRLSSSPGAVLFIKLGDR